MKRRIQEKTVQNYSAGFKPIDPAPITKTVCPMYIEAFTQTDKVICNKIVDNVFGLPLLRTNNYDKNLTALIKNKIRLLEESVNIYSEAISKHCEHLIFNDLSLNETDGLTSLPEDPIKTEPNSLGNIDMLYVPSPEEIPINPPKTPDGMVSLGPNHTYIEGEVYQTIFWASHTAATRKLMTLVFDKETLASHTLSGKPSPAFKNKPKKGMLDKLKIEDIIHAVKTNSGVSEKAVRLVMTMKCADENKVFKSRLTRLALQNAYEKENKENN